MGTCGKMQHHSPLISGLMWPTFMAPVLVQRIQGRRSNLLRFCLWYSYMAGKCADFCDVSRFRINHFRFVLHVSINVRNSPFHQGKVVLKEGLGAVLVENLRTVIRVLIWGFSLSCFCLPVTAGLDSEEVRMDIGRKDECASLSVHQSLATGTVPQSLLA